MSFAIVTDGELGVGVLVMRLASTLGMPLSGYATTLYAEAKTMVDIEVGLSRLVPDRPLSASAHRKKISKLNVESADVTIVCATRWTPFFDSLAGYTKMRKWQPVEFIDAPPFRPLLVLNFAEKMQNPEGMAGDISDFLRLHRPKKIFICGSTVVVEREKLIATLVAGIKSAQSFL
jgi:hypothetical protein